MNHKYLLSFIFIFLTLIAISPMAFADLTTDLIAYYKLDETSGTTAYDSLGNYNGTNTNVTINQTGKINNAYQFTKGINTSLSLLPLGSAGTQTRNYWIKIIGNNYGQVNGTIENSSTGKDGWGTIIDSTGVTIFGMKKNLDLWTNSTNYTFTESSATIDQNTWYMITTTLDNTSKIFKIYVNGSLIDTRSETAITSITNDIDLGFGWAIYNQSSSHGFGGLIDEIGIWSRALTSTEVSALYNSGSGLSYPFISGTVTPSQVTGTYNNDFNVTLTTDQNGSTGIYYTTDGSTPDNTDTEYTGAITINATTNLKAVSYDGSNYSNIMDETYTMEVGGTPTTDKNSGTYYEPISVALNKDGTTTGTTLTYTTNGTDPTIASTEYTTPITIAIDNDANTTLKFAEFKTGYTPSAIQTLVFDIHDANLNLQFYDENTLAKLDGNVSIVDLTNSETYYADANGFFSQYLTDIDWKEKQINSYVERKVNGVTTHTSRNLQFYWTNEDHDYNFMLLPIDLGENIEFLVKDTNDNLWTNKYVQFLDSDLNLISSTKTDSEGKFTSYLKTDGDYNAVLYDATGIEGDTYQKTTVNVKKPKNEKSLADISPYDVEVGGLLIYSLSNQSAAQTSINIFGGTTSTYDFTVVDYNADPVDRTYIPRTYNVKNPFGSSYNTTYNLQPYLITKEDGVIPSIVVYDELKTPYPGITVSIFKQIEGTTQLVEQKKTDSTGRTSFVGFPLDTYFVYLYENGTLKGSYEIQVRDTGETFYFVISREVDQDVVYRGLDLKYSWNNTPEYVDISSTDIDLNLSVYAYYLNDFNIISYEFKAYQNNTLKETLTGDLSGTSVTITDSLNRLNYTAGMPVKIVANITFNYAGQTRVLNLLKTINVDSKSTGLLTVLKNFPEKVGVLWTIILSILITISILVLFGTSDFVSKDYLMYVGLFILGFFVFIGWFATGVEVFGIDSMWFIYIVTVIASVGFALQDSQR
jgi:5-hydroxyisourate hydrolase-like protein (transthyretin family)